MDTQKMKKRLEDAQRAIQFALKMLAEESVVETPERYNAKMCALCGQPILPNDEVRRDRHLSCYMRFYASFIKTKQMTLDEAEAEGLIGKPAKPGRKQVLLDEIQDKAQAIIKRRKKQKD